MPPQEIRKFVFEEPFIPFRMYVSDGSSYEVTAAEYVEVYLLHVSVGIDPDESGLPRRTVHIAPNHITRVEFLLSGKLPQNNRHLS
jgi:hypothetical protein